MVFLGLGSLLLNFSQILAMLPLNVRRKRATHVISCLDEERKRDAGILWFRYYVARQPTYLRSILGINPAGHHSCRDVWQSIEFSRVTKKMP